MSEVEKRVTAVLVAAGSSTRMGFDKLSFDLGGETAVSYTHLTLPTILLV